MRKIKRNFFLVLAAISLITAGIVVLNFNSFAATTVTHTFSVSPAGGGQITRTASGYPTVVCPPTCRYTYNYSSAYATYGATPASGYKFLYWERTSPTPLKTYPENPLRTPMNITRTITGKFEKLPTPPPAPTPTPAPAPKTTSSTPKKVQVVKNEDIVAPVVDKEPPSAPSSLAAEYSKEDSSINLVWAPSTDNTVVEGYEIERIEKDKTEWEKVDVSKTEGYSDFNFEPEKTYIYRVRAYDQVKNYSEYSNSVDVSAGAFEPNVTVKDGGKVSDIDQKVTLEFNAGAVAEDLFVSIEKTDSEEFTLEKNMKTIGNVYDIRAKNIKGDEISSFKSQIALKFNYSKTDAKGANTGTIKMATLKEGKIEYLRTKHDLKAREIRTITDHISTYMLVAEKSSPLLTFLRILLWIFIIIAVVFGGYFGWIYYQKQKYQKEHRDDYIYKH